MEFVFESKRLGFRKLTEADGPLVRRLLQDPDVMYAWEHAFSEEECDAWLSRQIGRYKSEGFSNWAILRKADGAFLGASGLTLQRFGERMVPEIGYLLCKDYWHRGYATEAAMACRDYAFDVLHLPEVYSIMRENNAPSIAVAQRNGMKPVGRQDKFYYGKNMPHLVYRIEADERPKAEKHEK